MSLDRGVFIRVLRNEWANLLHACSACNGKKWNVFPTGADNRPLLIDPSNAALDPEDHLEFGVDDENPLTFGGVTPKNGSELGKSTIDHVGLDLVAHRYGRMRTYKTLYAAYIDILESPEGTTKRQKVASFRNLLLANNEYAALARAFARKKNVSIRFGVSMPVGEE